MSFDTALDGVRVLPLRVIEDARGAVLHMFRSDAPGFTRFGEVYFSEIKPNVVKAWKRHHRTTQRLAVPIGRVKFVLFDDRPESASRGRSAEFILGRPDQYALLEIPPLVWYGWRCLGEVPALVANCVDAPHDPAESEQAASVGDLADYRW